MKSGGSVDLQSKKTIAAMRELYHHIRRSVPCESLEQIELQMPLDQVHDNLSIIQWLRAAFETLLKGLSSAAVYEPIIQKLESDVRGHIRMQQEMKLVNDSLHLKINENKEAIQRIINQNVVLRKKNQQLRTRLGEDRTHASLARTNDENREANAPQDRPTALRSARNSISSASERSLKPSQAQNKARISTLLEEKLSRGHKKMQRIEVVSRKVSCDRLMPKPKIL